MTDSEAFDAHVADLFASPSGRVDGRAMMTAVVERLARDQSRRTLILTASGAAAVVVCVGAVVTLGVNPLALVVGLPSRIAAVSGVDSTQVMRFLPVALAGLALATLSGWRALRDA